MDRTGRRRLEARGDTKAKAPTVPCRRRRNIRAFSAISQLWAHPLFLSSAQHHERIHLSLCFRESLRHKMFSGRSCACLLMLCLLLLLGSQEIAARRGRSRSRSKSRVQIGLPITGKYRDPESDQYYNNQHGAKILLASHFDLEYVLGHKIAFLCVARGSPRPHITWYKDGNEIYTHLYLHVHEWQMGIDKVKSKLEIDPATQMDAGVYECTADNMYSIDRRSFKTDFSIAFD